MAEFGIHSLPAVGNHESHDALAVAAWIVRHGLPPRPSVTLTSLLIIGIPAAMIGAQPDLGTAILVAASGVFVVFMAGVSWWQILSAAAAAVVCLACLAVFTP